MRKVQSWVQSSSCGMRVRCEFFLSKALHPCMKACVLGASGNPKVPSTDYYRASVVRRNP